MSVRQMAYNGWWICSKGNPMISSPFTVDVPLRTDENGVIRIGKTRVTLQTVIADLQRGASPKEIADHFPVLNERDVYLVVEYYQQHREAVDEYIRQQEEVVAKTRQEFEKIFPQEGFKAELLARQEKKHRSQD